MQYRMHDRELVSTCQSTSPGIPMRQTVWLAAQQRNKLLSVNSVDYSM